MSINVVDWVSGKLAEKKGLEILRRTPEGILVVRAQDDYEFTVAVLGVKGLIRLADVAPLFEWAIKPQLVINVPSSALWTGAAIDFVHQAPAAFGTLGKLCTTGRPICQPSAIQ